MNFNSATIRFLMCAVFVLFCSDAALGCLCKPETPKKRVAKMRSSADVIFAGKVAAAGRDHTEQKMLVFKAEFEVEKAWKGKETLENNKVEIQTRGGCAVSFEKDGEYLVYAKRNEKGMLETDVCMGSGLIEFSDEDLKELGEPEFSVKLSAGSNALLHSFNFQGFIANAFLRDVSLFCG